MNIDDITKLIDDGKTANEISSLVGISKRNLYLKLGNISKELRKRLGDQSHKENCKHLINKHDWYIDNKIKVEQIVALINDGKSMTELINQFEVSTKRIISIAKLNDIYTVLKQNNKTYNKQVNQIKSSNKTSRMCELIDNYWGKDIYNIMSSGGLMTDILNLIDKDYHHWVPQYIKLYNLHDIHAANRKKFYTQHMKKMSENAAKATKGTHYLRHSITDEMREYFLFLHDNDHYHSDAMKLFHAKFNTSRSVVPILMRELNKVFKKRPPKFLTGKDNLMYGKEPSIKSGSGIRGHIYAFGEKIHFRSSLELLVYIYLIEHNITFSLSKHCVYYDDKEKHRWYFPDIVIDNCVYEIKPTVKLQWYDTIIKFNALKEYCHANHLLCDFITEQTYDLSSINLELIQKYINQGIILINDIQYMRLKKYIKW